MPQNVFENVDKMPTVFSTSVWRCPGGEPTKISANVITFEM